MSWVKIGHVRGKERKGGREVGGVKGRRVGAGRREEGKNLAGEHQRMQREGKSDGDELASAGKVGQGVGITEGRSVCPLTSAGKAPRRFPHRQLRLDSS